MPDFMLRSPSSDGDEDEVRDSCDEEEGSDDPPRHVITGEPMIGDDEAMTHGLLIEGI